MIASDQPQSLAAFQDYALGLLAPEAKAFTDTYLARARAAGFPDIHVNPEQGLFLAWLTGLIGAKHILEVGTLGGYSAWWFLRGLDPKGSLTTIEFRELQAEFARKTFADSGVADRVDIYTGFAKDILQTLQGPYDLVFLDASKYEYPLYLDHALRLTKKGSLIIADNIWQNGIAADTSLDLPAARGMAHYNALMAEHPNLESCILPFHGMKGLDGMTISRVV